VIKSSNNNFTILKCLIFKWLVSRNRHC